MWLEAGSILEAAPHAMGSAGDNSAAAASTAESAYWQVLDTWSDRIRAAATLDRETLMGLHLAVEGGYVPVAWVEKHHPAIAKQLVILRNHKAAVDRSCLQWSWDKYVQGVSQKVEQVENRARSRSRERPCTGGSSAASGQPAPALRAASVLEYGARAPEVPAGLTIPWEHCALPMPTFWSDRA